jgi:hypothetical protein
MNSKFHKVTPETTNFIKCACYATKASLYRRLSFKYRIASLNIFFNSQCISYGVFPKYINLKWKETWSSAGKYAVEVGKRAWLKRELHEWYVKRDAISHYLLLLHTELTYELHWAEWLSFDDDVRQKGSEIAFLKKATILRKLQTLGEKKCSIPRPVADVTCELPHSFGEKLVNLSDHVFQPDELRLLEKGLKYVPNIPVSTRDIINLAVDCEVALSKAEVGDKQLVAREIEEYFSSNLHPTKRSCPESHILKSIMHSIKTEELIVQKADKGNAMVFLKRNEYITKCEEFIRNNNITELKKDPTATFQKDIKSAIKSCPTLFSPYDSPKLVQMNPSAPRFFGLPKVHKPGIPIRPVVSNVSAPNHLLARRLNQVYRQNSKFSPKYGVINSADLAVRLSRLVFPPKCTLVSFDVTNLFPSVPPEKAILLAEEILLRKRVPAPIVLDLQSALKTCVSQNYFKFNEKLFLQTEGLAMGSPLSPLLADIYMDNFEKELFASVSPLLKNVCAWFRYVDDILCVWTGSVRQLDNFFHFINSLDKCIQFTMEKEKDGSLNFLDVNISREVDKFNFSIFRKDSYTDQVIHATSRHHFSQKLSAFHAMLHRALNIPMSPANREKELSVIKQIAANNGYKTEMIDRLYLRKVRNMAVKTIYGAPPLRDGPEKWRKFLYLGDISLRTTKFFKRQEIRPAFYNRQNLGSFLSKAKDIIPRLEKSGVYKLVCECSASYIGQTGRKFKERLKEHIACFKNGQSQSNFASHLLDNNHQSDFSLEILHYERKGQRLDALEQIEILKCLNGNCEIVNDLVYTSRSPLLNLSLFHQPLAHSSKPQPPPTPTMQAVG